MKFLTLISLFTSGISLFISRQALTKIDELASLVGAKIGEELGNIYISDELVEKLIEKIVNQKIDDYLALNRPNKFTLKIKEEAKKQFEELINSKSDISELLESYKAFIMIDKYL